MARPRDLGLRGHLVAFELPHKLHDLVKKDGELRNGGPGKKTAGGGQRAVYVEALTAYFKKKGWI